MGKNAIPVGQVVDKRGVRVVASVKPINTQKRRKRVRDMHGSDSTEAKETKRKQGQKLRPEMKRKYSILTQRKIRPCFKRVKNVREPWNIARAKQLLDSLGDHSEYDTDVNTLKRVIDLASCHELVDGIYNHRVSLWEHRSHVMKSRYTTPGQVGLMTLSKRARACMFQGVLVELDLCKCYPNILISIFGREEIPCPMLTAITDDSTRAAIISTIVTRQPTVTEADIKQGINAMIGTGNYTKYTLVKIPELDAIHGELFGRGADSNIFGGFTTLAARNADLFVTFSRKPNPVGSFVSAMLQNEERRNVDALMSIIPTLKPSRTTHAYASDALYLSIGAGPRDWTTVGLKVTKLTGNRCVLKEKPLEVAPSNPDDVSPYPSTIAPTLEKPVVLFDMLGTLCFQQEGGRWIVRDKAVELFNHLTDQGFAIGIFTSGTYRNRKGVIKQINDMIRGGLSICLTRRHTFRPTNKFLEGRGLYGQDERCKSLHQFFRSSDHITMIDDKPNNILPEDKARCIQVKTVTGNVDAKADESFLALFTHPRLNLTSAPPPPMDEEGDQTLFQGELKFHNGAEFRKLPMTDYWPFPEAERSSGYGHCEWDDEEISNDEVYAKLRPVASKSSKWRFVKDLDDNIGRIDFAYELGATVQVVESEQVFEMCKAPPGQQRVELRTGFMGSKKTTCILSMINRRIKELGRAAFLYPTIKMAYDAAVKMGLLKGECYYYDDVKRNPALRAEMRAFGNMRPIVCTFESFHLLTEDMKQADVKFNALILDEVRTLISSLTSLVTNQVDIVHKHANLKSFIAGIKNLVLLDAHLDIDGAGCEFVRQFASSNRVVRVKKIRDNKNKRDVMVTNPVHFNTLLRHAFLKAKKDKTFVFAIPCRSRIRAHFYARWALRMKIPFKLYATDYDYTSIIDDPESEQLSKEGMGCLDDWTDMSQLLMDGLQIIIYSSTCSVGLSCSRTIDHVFCDFTISGSGPCARVGVQMNARFRSLRCNTIYITFGDDMFYRLSTHFLSFEKALEIQNAKRGSAVQEATLYVGAVKDHTGRALDDHIVNMAAWVYREGQTGQVVDFCKAAISEQWSVWFFNYVYSDEARMYKRSNALAEEYNRFKQWFKIKESGQLAQCVAEVQLHWDAAGWCKTAMSKMLAEMKKTVFAKEKTVESAAETRLFKAMSLCLRYSKDGVQRISIADPEGESKPEPKIAAAMDNDSEIRNLRFYDLYDMRVSKEMLNDQLNSDRIYFGFEYQSRHLDMGPNAEAVKTALRTLSPGLEKAPTADAPTLVNFTQLNNNLVVRESLQVVYKRLKGRAAGTVTTSGMLRLVLEKLYNASFVAEKHTKAGRDVMGYITPDQTLLALAKDHDAFESYVARSKQLDRESVRIETTSSKKRKRPTV